MVCLKLVLKVEKAASVKRDLTCCVQEHRESVGTKSNTNFQSVACKDKEVKLKFFKTGQKLAFIISCIISHVMFSSEGRCCHVVAS